MRRTWPTEEKLENRGNEHAAAKKTESKHEFFIKKFFVATSRESTCEITVQIEAIRDRGVMYSTK